MARIGSNRKAPKQKKQHTSQKKELSQFELFKKHGGIRQLDLSIDRYGAWHKRGKYYSEEDAFTEIANATGLEIGTPEFNAYIAEISPSKKHGGNVDRLILNRYLDLEREFGKYGTSALDSTAKQRTNKRLREYIQWKAFWQYTSTRWIGKPIEERIGEIKKQFKVDTLEEAFQEFKNSMDIDTFADAVMSVDESMLKAFGLDDKEIADIRAMGETDRYHYIKEHIKLGPGSIKLMS